MVKKSGGKKLIKVQNSKKKEKDKTGDFLYLSLF
jgi:hypothetical protein